MNRYLERSKHTLSYKLIGGNFISGFSWSQLKRRSLLACLLASLVLLGGCTIKLTYHYLDNLIGWQIGQYVTLEGEQKAVAEEAIDEFHQWHRRTQLPLYISYLQQLKSGMLAGPITAEYLHTESNKLQDLIDLSMQKALPTITQIAATLSATQIQEVVSNLEKEREEYREDYIDAKPSKVQKRRIRNITRYVGGFFGRLNDEQKHMLTEWEENLQPHEVLMNKQQENWQNDFLAAMAFQDQPLLLQPKLKALMLYRTDNWDIELQKQLDHNQALTFNMLADLFNSQTPKQREKMKRKFDQYIEDLQDLAKKAKSAQT